MQTWMTSAAVAAAHLPLAGVGIDPAFPGVTKAIAVFVVAAISSLGALWALAEFARGKYAKILAVGAAAVIALMIAGGGAVLTGIANFGDSTITNNSTATPTPGAPSLNGP